MSIDQSTIEGSADAGGEAAGDGAAGDGAGLAQGSLTVTDNRTGESYELPIHDGTVRAMDLRQIKADEQDFGLMAYDPAYTNTASCRSAITYIDGEAGILQHRGYPIEQLCEGSTYLEVAYLLINGRLPTQTELTGWVDEITIHTFVHENAGLSLRRQPHGHARRLGRRPLDLLSGRKQDPRGACPCDADHQTAREDADAGGVRLPP
jgi:hypothetical protein